MAAPIRVVLAEDNDVFRSSLELMFSLRPRVEIVAAVGDGVAALAACEKHRPDVLLMDYRLPGLDGVELARTVRERLPGVAVICLTASATEATFEALRAAGVRQCLEKHQTFDEIVGAVEASAERPAA